MKKLNLQCGNQQQYQTNNNKGGYSEGQAIKRVATTDMQGEQFKGGPISQKKKKRGDGDKLATHTKRKTKTGKTKCSGHVTFNSHHMRWWWWYLGERISTTTITILNKNIIRCKANNVGSHAGYQLGCFLKYFHLVCRK